MFSNVTDLPMSQALLIAVVGFFIVFSELVLISFAVLLISKSVRAVEGFFAKRKPVEVSAEPAVLPLPESPAEKQSEGTPLPTTQSQGSLDLIDTDEATAAVIMAIVSDRSGIPLNRLNFKSIKQIDN